ncbi:hypothetical protein [Persicobacter diffluens]|uniref:Sortilin N-terminal domain-containing protein n=1 Tax=Persicobacter diffluens TaxID=981 RepID=A0AAN4W0K1_9BACT|nr:hypothetical protein PEDI_30580 [Persicobacter diffluens]
MGNDYVSVDAGKHWESCIPINEVWTKRIPLSDECVVSDHKDNNIVLSLNKKQLVLSTDGGKNFKKITHFAKGKAPSSLWYSATPHPVKKGTWFLGNGLDNKYVRTGTNPNPLDGIDLQAPKVWKVTNITSNKRTIEAIDNKGMEDATAVFKVFCHPNTNQYPEMLFAATSTGFYRKRNARKAWEKLLAGSIKADYRWDGKKLNVYALQQTTYSLKGHLLLSKGGVNHCSRKNQRGKRLGRQNRRACSGPESIKNQQALFPGHGEGLV